MGTKGLPGKQLKNNQMWRESTKTWESLPFALKYKLYHWQFLEARTGLQNKWTEEVPETADPWVLDIVQPKRTEKKPISDLHKVCEDWKASESSDSSEEQIE